MSQPIQSFDRSIAINVGGGDQVLAAPSRGVYISTAGNIVCRLRNGASDTTFTGLLAGNVYYFEITAIRQTGTTAAGLVLYGT